MDILSPRGSAGQTPGHFSEPKGIRSSSTASSRSGRGFHEAPAIVGTFAALSRRQALRMRRLASVRRQVIAASYETPWKTALAIEAMFRQGILAR